MSNLHSIISVAKQAIEIEYKAIQNLIPLVDEEFANAVNCIYQSKGRVIITGIGKSAIIANKIVATLNSTGTPAILCMLQMQFMVTWALFKKKTS